MPGPACYGRGGTDATVTDANLVLGYLDPAHFLGGSATLDAAAAEARARSARRGAEASTASPRPTACIASSTPTWPRASAWSRCGAASIRGASRCSSFGGAAGLHVTDVARQLDLTRVVVPRVAAVLSAWGMLATDLRFEVSRTHIGDTARLDGAGIKRLFAEMEQEGLARLRASFDGPVRVQRSVEMRYGEQIFEITVPLDGIDWDADDPLPQIVERFHHRHEELYTYALRDQERGAGERARRGDRRAAGRAAGAGAAGAGRAAPRGERRVWLRGWTSVPVFDFDALAPGQAIAGPAIVEVGDDDGAAAAGQSGDGDAARLAGYRGVGMPPPRPSPLRGRGGLGVRCSYITKLIADGLPTWTSCPVGVSIPLTVSTANATMLSLS